MGTGTGLFSMFRDLGSPTGSSFSLAVFGTTLAYQTHSSLTRLGESAGLGPETVTALADIARTRQQTVPAELAERAAASGVDAQALLRQAGLEGLEAALTNVGYLLIAMIGLALVLVLRIARSSPAPAPSGAAGD